MCYGRALFENSNLIQTALFILSAAVLRFSAEAAEFSVTSTGDSGAGTLRQAVLNANATPGPDLITFNFSGGAPFTITPLTGLPNITDPVTINGASQPGYAGLPLVGLVGTGAGSVTGLDLLTSNTTVRALFINRFNGSGVQIQGGQNNVIAGCFIGTSPGGTTKLVNAVAGIAILNGRNNRIGGTDAADRNLLSGNQTGLWIGGLSATGNVVLGNFIGTDVNGTISLGNANNGVLIGSPGNIIGGTEPGARNVISGNGQSGVYLNDAGASNNWVAGNFIGTTSSGASGRSNSADGVTIFRAAHNLIGGSTPGAGNVISANGERGIYLFTTTANQLHHNRIKGNFIGTDVTGRTNLGNRYSGVGLTLGHDNVIGGTNLLARNLISGNGHSGVTIDSNSVANVVAGNCLGLDVTGTNVLGNGFSGVNVAGGASNIIGGATPGARNVISGNAQNGVFLSGGAGHTVAGNWIGTDWTGVLRRGNGNSGVRVESAGHLIGGVTPLARNVISGNAHSGVSFIGTGASNNVLAGNFIGTGWLGLTGLGNGFYGVSLTNAPRNFIGTAEPGGVNLISGNANSGVSLTGQGATRNTIHGNFIGTDASGSFAIANVLGAINLYLAGTNFIGGAEPGAGNLLSGNENVVVYVSDSHGNFIRGNNIGLRADGATALPNFLHGIELLNTSSRNVIGGTKPGEGNRIANTPGTFGYDGVRVRDGCVGNVIRGNSIFNNGGAHPAGLGIDWSLDGPTTVSEPRFPALLSATGRHLTTINGTLNGLNSTAYTLDFYGNTALDSSSYGEGRRWLGTANITTGAGGAANFSVALTNAFATGGFLSATTTDAAGSTSEFALAIPITPAPDTDGDGMADDFEIAYGLNPNVPDADLDADGDGASNHQEFLASTKPNSAASALRVTMQPEAARTLVFVNSVPGRTYRFEVTPDLNSPWIPFSENLAGTGGPLRAVDTGGSTNRFFHVRVE